MDIGFYGVCERNAVCCKLQNILTHKLKNVGFVVRKIKIVVKVKLYLTIVLTPTTFWFVCAYFGKGRRDKGWHLTTSVELRLSHIQVTFKRNWKAVIICKKAEEENGKTKPFMPQLKSKLQDISYCWVKSIEKQTNKTKHLILAIHLLELPTLSIKKTKASTAVTRHAIPPALRFLGIFEVKVP